MAKKRVAKKQKGLLDELADLFAWWGRRQKKVAARKKKRAQALKDRNDAAEERQKAREVRAAERQRHIERTRTQRVLAAQRRAARIQAAGPVIRTVQGTVWPTETVGGHGGTVQGRALPCGQPTEDGSPCQRPVLPGTTDCGVPHPVARARGRR